MQTIEISKKAKLIKTAGGATGWLVGKVGGVEWVAYNRDEVKGMRAVLRKRLAK